MKGPCTRYHAAPALVLDHHSSSASIGDMVDSFVIGEWVGQANDQSTLGFGRMVGWLDATIRTRRRDTQYDRDTDGVAGALQRLHEIACQMLSVSIDHSRD